MLPFRSPRLLLGVIVMLSVSFFAWRVLLKKVSPVPLKGTRVPKPIAIEPVPVQSTDGISTLADYRGKWLVVFFGFTHCPDICPTSLAYIKEEYHALLELRPYVRMAFISVDAERDSAENCAAFVKNFEPEFSCLMLKPDALATITKQLGSHASKEGDSGSIAHSGDIYLISPEGEWTAYYRPPFAKSVLQEDLQKLIQRNL